MKLRPTATLAALALSAAAAFAQDAPFGTDADADYAAQLWTEMEKIGMVGDGMLRAFPYEGVEPHGLMLETFYTTASVNGHTGDLVVKRNYGPEGVSADAVLADPAKHLGAVTVMFRREKGYDADNQDWFWVKYLPDGTHRQEPQGHAPCRPGRQGCRCRLHRLPFGRGRLPLHHRPREDDDGKLTRTGPNRCANPAGSEPDDKPAGPITATSPCANTNRNCPAPARLLVFDHPPAKPGAGQRTSSHDRSRLGRTFSAGAFQNFPNRADRAGRPGRDHGHPGRRATAFGARAGHDRFPGVLPGRRTGARRNRHAGL